MQERERAITVGLARRGGARSEIEEHLAELSKLIETAGGEVVVQFVAARPSPDPATYIGSGKAEEIRDAAKSHRAGLVVFDDDLTAAQARNLEKIMEGVKVIDRSALILDIFARGAQSREARTQVELAQLEYMLPRLTRQWSHLSRQAGGIGTRGVGETQLEIDRRLVRTRISRLKEELKKIEQNRETQRKARGRVFAVALVGYTNAGKSTLFNALTASDAGAADKLFATLDARAHKSRFPFPQPTVFIDTVGFIRKLPHHLVASFRSTMEEAVAADLVLHVIDGSHPQASEQRDVGNEVLADLGVPPDRVIEVYNKADRFTAQEEIESHARGAVWVSALTGARLETLVEEIRRRQLARGEVLHLSFPAAESQLVAQLYDVGDVKEKGVRDDHLTFTAWVPKERVHLFSRWIDESAG